MTGTLNLADRLATLADRDSPRPEADLQSGVQTLLLYGGLNLEDPQVRLETPAPNRRRVDGETGWTVIDVKRELDPTNRGPDRRMSDRLPCGRMGTAEFTGTVVGPIP